MVNCDINITAQGVNIGTIAGKVAREYCRFENCYSSGKIVITGDSV